MARVSAFSTLDSIFCKPISHSIPSHSLKIPVRVRTHYFQSHAVANSFKHSTLLDNRTKKKSKTSTFYGIRRLRSVGEETQIPEEETEQQEAQLQEQGEQQTVSVPVSPSDTLTMHFQAEGTMSETAIPSVTAALKEVEGITDLKVKVLEGIASVELIKQTTVQATGVASSLVEAIQGSGFKLQTLNLSFEDEEDLVAL